MIVLGMDAAWSGLGWCTASPHGPLVVGHVRLRSATWRLPRLQIFLDEEILPQLVEANLGRAPGDDHPRIVIEEPPMVYSGASRAAKADPTKKAGNQTAVGYGLGRLAGAIELWSWSQRFPAYPWLVNPRTWRAWWSVGGKGRVERKRAAVRIVEGLRWGHILEPHAWTGEDGGAKADVAEAILIAVGAARHRSEAPAGPANHPAHTGTSP